jgi:transposase-like protein
MIAAAIRQIFAAESGEEARERLAGVVTVLERSAPKVARLLAEAEDELLAFMAFPAEHETKLRSTNPWSASSTRSAVAATWSASTRTTPPWCASPGHC